MDSSLVKKYEELAALAELMSDKANELKNSCHVAIGLMTDVSTPVLQKGLSGKQKADVVFKRRSRLKSH